VTLHIKQDKTLTLYLSCSWLNLVEKNPVVNKIGFAIIKVSLQAKF